jgi:hypothetical protein
MQWFLRGFEPRREPLEGCGKNALRAWRRGMNACIAMEERPFRAA